MEEKEEKDSEVLLLLDASWLDSSGREIDSILMSDEVVSVSRTSMPSGKQNRRFCCCCCCCCWRTWWGSMLISSKMVSMSVRLDELSLIAYKVVNWSFSCAISDRDLMIGKKSVICCCFRSIIGKKSVISCCFRCSLCPF